MTAYICVFIYLQKVQGGTLMRTF